MCNFILRFHFRTDVRKSKKWSFHAFSSSSFWNGCECDCYRTNHSHTHKNIHKHNANAIFFFLTHRTRAHHICDQTTNKCNCIQHNYPSKHSKKSKWFLSFFHVFFSVRLFFSLSFQFVLILSFVPHCCCFFLSLGVWIYHFIVSVTLHKFVFILVICSRFG